ncbi:hypothetical protein BJ741DRAFT_633962 [Chytriomyces cf. hyalinus JEL632]|nr:hypothetical protein BJ741DRAFT_633962 [Chytriomyces cf. hyalinus JEL632]
MCPPDWPYLWSFTTPPVVRNDQYDTAAQSKSRHIPVEVFQAIMKWVPPLEVLKFRRLSRFANACLTDPYLAYLNLSMFVEPLSNRLSQRSRMNEVHVHWPTPLDRVWNRFPQSFQAAYADLALVGMTALLLSDSKMGGQIPSLIGRVNTLLYLALDNCKLEGTIPAEIGQLKALKHLNLSKNMLSGGIPDELGDCASLERIYLGNNNFTGSIPSVLGRLVKLKHVCLSHNQLSGALPEELAALANIYWFDVSSNQIHREYSKRLEDNQALVRLLQEQRFYPAR